MEFIVERNRLGMSFIVSILIHLTFLALFAIFADLGVISLPPQAKKFIVELFEQPRKEPAGGVPEELKRAAPRNVKVKKETAPKKIPLPATPPPAPKKIATARSQPRTTVVAKKPAKKAEMPTPVVTEPAKKVAAKPPAAPEKKVETERAEVSAAREENLPRLSQLLPTVEQLAKPVPREELIRDVEEGDAVSLNTTEFKYISYFSKLKDRIKMVWKYPEAAKIAGIQGRLTLQFVINGDGSLRYVKVLNSSGIPILDDEAVKAVRKAAPFYAIPSDLGENLNVVANFEYILSSVYIR